MKIAYLVLAHDNPAQFHRLTRALTAAPGASVVAHIDRKVGADPFTRDAVPGVRFTQRRVRTFWGDWSVVEATLAALRTALADPAGHERFVLLSGTHHPVQPAGHLRDFFDRHRDVEFLSLRPVPSETKPITRISRYHPRHNGTRLTRRLEREALRRGLIRAERDWRAALGDLRPYAGDQWWALTRPAAEWVERRIRAERRAVRFLRHTDVPDEAVFHTLLGNSPFAGAARPTLTFTDWTAGGRSPAPMGAAHLERFGRPVVEAAGSRGGHEVLFARKFTDADAVLVDALDVLLCAKAAATSAPG